MLIVTIDNQNQKVRVDALINGEEIEIFATTSDVKVDHTDQRTLLSDMSDTDNIYLDLPKNQTILAYKTIE